MTYVKQTWENLPAISSPLSAERLNHLETQYDESVDYVDAQVVDLENQISNIEGNSADLVAELRYPLYISHRGGRLVMPEHSIEAYRRSFEDGFSPEADVLGLADGTLVCIHDTTTTRTMNISKSVASTTVDEWRNALVLPAVQSSGKFSSTGYGTPVFFNDYLDEFGGKIVLWPEIKSPSVSTAAIKAITDRGLHGSVVVQSGDFDVCREAVAAGLYALYLSNSAVPTDVVNAGIQFVGVPAAATNTYVNNLKAEGLKVIAYTVNTKPDADAQLARGCDGVFTDDPWETSRQYPPKNTLDLSKDYLPVASQWAIGASAGNAAAVVQNGVFDFTNSGSSASASHIKLGQFGYGGQTCQVRLWAQSFGRTSSEANWLFGVYLGRQVDDGPVTEDPTGSAFRLAVARRNGGKAVFRKSTLGATTESLGTTSDTAYAPANGRGEPMLFEIDFTPTTVSLKNLTRNDTDLTVTHATQAGDAHYITLCVNGGIGRVWGVSVSR